MQENVLEMNQVSKSYKNHTVLREINMKIARGSIYGLVGSNGAGKSTLMRLISGQSDLDGGELRLFGKNPSGREQRVRHRIGTLIEEPGLFSDFTARENLEYYRIQFGIPGKDAPDKMLSLVGLSDTGRKKYKNFSMGMKQRLGLALALLHSPEFLILDEPINGLDPQGILEIRNLLLKLNRERNMTILISSHILPELENIATEYGFLARGALVEQISANALKQKCGTYIDLEAGDVKQVCVLLEKDLSITEYQVRPDGHIHIFAGQERQEEISKATVMKGIPLKSIGCRTMELEDYYMNLIGGEKNA